VRWGSQVLVGEPKATHNSYRMAHLRMRTTTLLAVVEAKTWFFDGLHP
jgi:hypothetical protein